MTTTQVDAELEALLQYLRRTRGFDFTGYKRPSLSRRIAKRMEEVGVEGFGAYVDYLEVHPDEFVDLFNVILINVTGFFRDAPSWEALREHVVPAILGGKQPADPIRLWSPACSTGEEAYTLAILMAEAIGADAFLERVKIYATDVDEEALAFARQAAYSDQQLTAVPEDLVDQYFEPNGEGTRVFRQDLRRSVIFGRHDLVQDAPIARIDLLSCRNALMYFNAETQSRILARFHFALSDRGFLVLGKAESLLARNSDFEAVDLKRRIFRKVPRQRGRERMLGFTDDGEAPHAAVDGFGEAALEAVPSALFLVEPSGNMAFANRKARELFGITGADLGRPFHDLEVSFRPVELRSAMEQASKDRSIVTIPNVTWPSDGAPVSAFDAVVTPLMASGREPIGTMIVFVDITAHRQLEEELHAANRDLEVAYEELQSANEELETTNEELQSTVEELETTNEELQATNEELETMNEELQSANEELQTMNDELRDRTTELNRLNAFMDAVFTSMRQALAVVTPDLSVSVWNTYAEELWGLRQDEVEGKSLLALDFGLPLDGVRTLIRACLDGNDPEPVTVDAVNRRGRAIRCVVSGTAVGAKDGLREAVIVTMADEPA